jgi:hypothetical protein
MSQLIAYSFKTKLVIPVFQTGQREDNLLQNCIIEGHAKEDIDVHKVEDGEYDQIVEQYFKDNPPPEDPDIPKDVDESVVAAAIGAPLDDIDGFMFKRYSILPN